MSREWRSDEEKARGLAARCQSAGDRGEAVEPRDRGHCAEKQEHGHEGAIIASDMASRGRFVHEETLVVSTFARYCPKERFSLSLSRDDRIVLSADGAQRRFDQRSGFARPVS